MHGHWIPRETQLARCPDAGCRRAGLCRAVEALYPCQRTHDPLARVYDQISDRLRRMAIERGADAQTFGTRDIPDSYELDCKLDILKRGLEEREKEHDAMMLAQASARKR